MHDAAVVPEDYTRMVRNALAHLYDYAYLQNHPLAFTLSTMQSLDHVTRAQKLRRVLLDSIEALRPQDQSDTQSGLARSYAIMTYHYVSGFSIPEIADKLALSERQTYREHEKGVVAVASILWDMALATGATSAQLSVPTAPISDSDHSSIQAEVDRLRQAVQPDSLDLLDILDGVFATLAPLTQQTGTLFKVSSFCTGPSIIADRIMLRQTLLNLLRYALDLIEGDPVIAISQVNAGVQVDISGAPQRHSSLADPSAASEPREGYAVAQTLIEAQGGSLLMAHQQGRWHMQLVLRTARKVILVIDDNADLVSLFQRYLGGHDIAVVGAVPGEQALRLATELVPELITLDVMMPQQDGWEMLQKLKSTPGLENIPVVICSVLHESQLALAIGASDYITKPVSQVELLRVLQHWLGPLQPAA